MDTHAGGTECDSQWIAVYTWVMSEGKVLWGHVLDHLTHTKLPISGCRVL